jgi:DNA polymerase-3 subunit delta
MKVGQFLNRFSDAQLHAASRLFLEADGKLKGGTNSRPKIVMERLLLSLCESGKKPASDPPSRPPVPAERGTSRTLSNVRTIRSGKQTGR